MFSNFPEFLPLTIEFKEAYNNAVKDYPPYSDISIATLQIWWNLENKLSVSVINNNLVINYNQPFDKNGSGMSLIGTNHIDDSIDTIFSYLKNQGTSIRLVHVPEFVVDNIRSRDSLNITEEPDYHEYILDSKSLSSLEGHQYKGLRHRINRFNKETAGKELELKSLDLSLADVREKLLVSLFMWEKKHFPNNDPDKTEHLALKTSMESQEALDIKNLALYIDGELHGIVIYHRPLGKEYYVLHHLRVNYDTSYITDYLHQKMAAKAVKENVPSLNIEMDLGIDSLKIHKMRLKPSRFLKKYTITPRQ